MYYVIKKQRCIDFNIRIATMCESLEDKKIYFRKDFEQVGFSCLSFDSHKEILDYLYDKYAGRPQFYLCGDVLYFVESEADRRLEYYATIREV